jgi:Uma2 family endonuclease
VVTTSILGEQRVLLQEVSWQLFEQPLAELSQTRSARLTYDQGMLEIMTPLMSHERNNRLIEKLIDILAEELNLNIMSVGSMTCKRQDLGKGAEPDSNFYIQNEPLMRSKENVDLRQDPPPNLVVEIEYSKSAIDQLDLYAAMGIPEFWRYNGNMLRIYQLEAGQYISRSNSPTFLPIQTHEIPRFLQQSLEIGEMAVKKTFRAWVKEQL